VSISTTTNRVSYAGDGSTTVFPYNFLILANTDLEVIETVTATGVETIKTLTTHYTVSGAGTGSGNVTMVTAPASGTTLTIRRKMPRTQLVDYVENDSFPAATHEQALDKLTMIAQELDQTVKRSLRQPEGDSADIDYLPAKSQRSSKYLAFDADGNPVATSVVTPGQLTVTSFIETLLDDANATEARATLGIPLTAFPAHTQAGNVDNTAKGYLGIPSGTTAQRPGSPNSGMIRYNTETSKFEGYGSAWGQLGGGATGAGADQVFFENDQTVNNDYTITSGKNAMSAGPITIASGKTVTVPSGSTWVVV